MPGFTLCMTLLAVLLGALSLVISGYAAKIAKKSDEKMTALSNSQIDEKLAMMTTHQGIIADQPDSTDAIQRFKKDFKAIHDLKDYTSEDKEEELKTYISSILAMLKNQVGYPGIPNSEWEKAFEEIKQLAQNYDIE